ncbi:uncharacterized protein LOC117178760 [Belonocnema kinseyi]|uniref:uncharacterized protein LOC117178760 n=1 Tax=Belonocnema kinseyi TaxID=2817044 RepID=UPI00143DEEB5|nr:uncharacterized protein LOC117178760 [Belonocnema kinseyi]
MVHLRRTKAKEGKWMLTYLGQVIQNEISISYNNYFDDVDDIRGQCYDNGSNMRGQLKGVQSRILQINPRAFFVPCNPHSLNLVVNDVAKANVETINVASKLLRDRHMNLPESVNILEDLSMFFTEKRTDEAFKEYLTEATNLATALKVDIEFKNLMGTRQRVDDPEKSFKLDFYFTILDVIIMPLQERFEFIRQFENMFGFVFNSTAFLRMDKLDILEKCKNLQENLTNEDENRSDILSVDLYDKRIA